MAELEAFRENFYSTAAMLGGNSGGYMSFMPSGSLVAMTGLPYAGENYAIFNSDATHCEVAEAIDIFALRNIPFTPPSFPKWERNLPRDLKPTVFMCAKITPRWFLNAAAITKEHHPKTL